MPENPSDAWLAALPREQWDAAVYRLGNLTLLEVASNRTIGNSEYSIKLEHYRRSGYAVTRDIADIAPEEWTLPLIDERQRRLAARAAHIWRSDFAQ